MAQTLDQRRAQYAWDCASRRQTAKLDGYRELAKGAPALVMGSGLMPALAYYQSRTGSNKDPAKALLADLLGWLAKRHMVPNDFGNAMENLVKSESMEYMQATHEVLALLKWLRQFADALNGA
jgi:CRISPR-associated protein Cmr5